MNNRLFRAIGIDSPPDDFHRLFKRLCPQGCQTDLVESNTVFRHVIDDVEITAEISENLLCSRAVISLAKLNPHFIITHIKAAESDFPGTELLAYCLGNGFETLLRHNIHFDTQKQMRTALEVKPEIDLLARQETAASIIVPRHQVWRRIHDAKNRDQDHDKLFPSFKL